tara:strand:+ start:97 stop:384 length:288 start_codon:yes stop_codon:yes gene_type:complete
MGFLRPKSNPPKPMEQIEDKLKPVPMPDFTPNPGELIEDNPVLFKDGMANTTDPQDEGKGSKRKGKGKGGTILTSVTGVSGQPQLGKPSLLGGSY